MRKLTLASLTLLLATSLFAAEEAKKPLSPPAKAEATIGGKKITIDYSAPSKRNRTIMGELVPFDQVWRTGANAATTLTTTGDLMIGNVHVPAGTYSLFTIPSKDHWTLIVSKQTGLWGSNKYDQKQDLGRVRMTVKPVADTVETFAIDVKPTGEKNGALSLTWENTQAIVPIIMH
jgi:hypothetical protein